MRIAIDSCLLGEVLTDAARDIRNGYAISMSTHITVTLKIARLNIANMECMVLLSQILIVAFHFQLFMPN